MRKKYGIWICCLVVAISWLGYSGYKWFDRYSQTAMSSRSKMPYTIGATYMTLTNPFFTIIDQQVQSQIEAKEDVLISLDPALDIQKQQEQIEYLIDQGVDALLINPVDFDGLRSQLKKAQENGIVVVTVDTEVRDSKYVDYNVVSDNYDAGIQCANDMMKHLDSANIVLIRHDAANSGYQRIKGFLDTIQGHENYRVVHEIDSEGQLEIAMPKMEEFLKTGQKIDVIMCLNDPSALGALAALQSMDRLEGVLVYGVDGTPDAKMMVNAGLMQGTVAQSPIELGNKAIDAIYALLEGKTLKKEERLPVEMITKENISSYSLEAWQ